MFLLLLGCDPYRSWPDPTTVFPYVYTPEAGLEDYELVRFETETWRVEEDAEQLASYILKSQLHRKSAPVESLEHFAAMKETIPVLGAGTTLSFAGDSMWLGGNWLEFASPVEGLFEGIRMGNLETPTDPAQSTEQGALGLYAFNSSPEMLENLPFDLLQLNNNHSLDAGNSGLEATIAEVESRGITYTGVNAHAEIQEIAFLSYTWGLNDPSVPTSHELFIVPFGHIGEDIDLSSIAEDIEQARAGGAQSVVVMLHWGFEYEYYPDPHFLVLAREIIASGADLIAGSGPHVVQPPELCYVNHPEVVPGVGTCSLQTEDGQPRMAAVLYSLGNFATTMATLPCQAGIAAMVTLNPDVTGLGWKGLVSVRGESGIEVVPLSKAEGEEVEAEAGRLEEHLGAGWKVH